MPAASSVAVTVVSRVYLALVALLVLPLYLRQVGPEVFGLVALFFLLQVWLQLLDMGLTATLAREAARFRAGALTLVELRQLLSAFERIFMIALVLTGAVVLATSDLVAQRWLNLESIAPVEASRAIQLMALCVLVRLLGDLYRAAISGFERLVWLAGSNSLFGTARLLGVIPFLAWAGDSASNFFIYQLFVGTLEMLTLLVMAHRLVPSEGVPLRGWGLRLPRAVVGFSLAMSAASVVWVLASQIDKVVLSGRLTLTEFGAFSLAVSAAAGVLLVTGSLADTLIPRITVLRAEGCDEQVAKLYSQATQWTAVVGFGVAVIMACHAERILRAWTGDVVLAASVAPVLAMYALGNAAMAVGAMPYYLQLARGRLRLHLMGTGLMICLLVPCVLWGTERYGATGAAVAWLVVNLLYLLAWTPVAHRYFGPGRHQRWIWHDVLPIAALAGAAGLVSRALPWPDDRLGTTLLLLVALGATLLFAALASSSARDMLRRVGRAQPEPHTVTTTE